MLLIIFTYTPSQWGRYLEVNMRFFKLFKPLACLCTLFCIGAIDAADDEVARGERGGGGGHMGGEHFGGDHPGERRDMNDFHHDENREQFRHGWDDAQRHDNNLQRYENNLYDSGGGNVEVVPEGEININPTYDSDQYPYYNNQD